MATATPTSVNMTSNLTQVDTAANEPARSQKSPHYAELDSSKLTIHTSAHPKVVPLANSPEVASQGYTTDHMLKVRWTAASGWDAPQICPYGPLSLMPTASVLHYATECFEGLKAYRGYDGKLRLFRPDRNAKRFLQSAQRITLPSFSSEEFLTLLKKFVGIEGPRWLPDRGSFVYLRPTMIGTTSAIKAQRPNEALMYVIAVCFPSLDEPPSSLKPIDLATEKKKGMRLLTSHHDEVRAWPGGTGNTKVGANYGPVLIASEEAKKKGYDQILWLFGDECFVTEAGGSNFFVLWTNEEQQLELVTAPLGDGLILEGVTRASVLDLVRQNMHHIGVVERKFTMPEIVAAQNEGRLVEAFVVGTAFFIVPCGEIHFRGSDILLPLARNGEAKYAMAIKELLKDMMYGKVEHKWAVVVEEEPSEDLQSAG